MTDDTLVERVARVIWNETYLHDMRLTFNELETGQMHHSRVMLAARAAIAATRADNLPLTTLDELNKAHREPTLDDHKRAVKEMLDRGKREQGR